MCGIYGFSGSNLDLKNLYILGLQNMTRGVDASGFFLETKKNYLTDKDSATADILLSLYQDRFEKYQLSEDKITFFLGHNRAATIGIKNKENAHPFHVKRKDDPAVNKKDIVLVHNGTLRNYYNMINKFDKIKHKDINVDSQVFAHYFAKYDNTEILKRFEGAAALVWKDVNQNHFFVFRNDERPLHYGFINDNMYFSSLSLPLELIGCTDIKEFEERKIYKIENGVILEVSEVIPHEAFVYTYANSNSGTTGTRNANMTVVHNSSKIDLKYLNSEDFDKIGKNKIEKLIKNLNNKKFKDFTLSVMDFDINSNEIKFHNGSKAFVANHLSFEIKDSSLLSFADWSKSYQRFFYDSVRKRVLVTTVYKTSANNVILNYDQVVLIEKKNFIKESKNNQNNSKDEASEDENIHFGCFHCNGSSSNIVCNCSLSTNNIEVISEKEFEQVKCVTCDSSGWDDKKQEMCSKCKGVGFVTLENNEENIILTEEYMDELTNSVILLKSIEDKYKEVLDKETLDRISEQVEKNRAVLIEQKNEV